MLLKRFFLRQIVVFFQTSVASSIKPIWLLDYFISFYVGCISFEEPDDLSICIQFNNADFNSVNQFASDAMQNIRFILKHKKTINNDN